jgi:hypothetical protein
MRIFPHTTLTFYLFHLKKLISFSECRLAIFFEQRNKSVNRSFGCSSQLFFCGARVNWFKIRLNFMMYGISLEKSHFIFYDTWWEKVVLSHLHLLQRCKVAFVKVLLLRISQRSCQFLRWIIEWCTRLMNSFTWYYYALCTSKVCPLFNRITPIPLRSIKWIRIGFILVEPSNTC